VIRAAGVDASYDGLQVLWDVSVAVAAEDGVVAVVGPNGAGKSTLLRVLSGLHPADAGEVTVDGDPVAELTPAEVVRRGFVHVPEERHLFGEMSVAENLRMGAYTSREGVEGGMEAAFELFPALAEHRDRPAAALSGGQQQMLAVARGLMAEPRVLALDEPSEGLAPQLTRRLFDAVERVSQDTAVLLVEQHVSEALELADRAYLLENGRVAAEGTGGALLADDRVREAYL
jgi:branched-chain amino acid transport system ATP-binding protein